MVRFLRVNWKGGNEGRDTDLHPADAKWHAAEGRCEIVEYVDILEASGAADKAKPKRTRKAKAQPVETAAAPTPEAPAEKAES
jgi:hypothetical protein